MATRNEQKWQANFNKLKAYIEEHGQLPDKKKEPDRNLLMMLSNMRVRHL